MKAVLCLLRGSTPNERKRSLTLRIKTTLPRYYKKGYVIKHDATVGHTVTSPITVLLLGREFLDGDFSVSRKRHPRLSLCWVCLFERTTRGALNQLPGLARCHQLRALGACVLGKISQPGTVRVFQLKYHFRSAACTPVTLSRPLSLTTRLSPFPFRPAQSWYFVSFLSRSTLLSGDSLSPSSNVDLAQVATTSCVVLVPTNLCLRQPPNIHLL